jgi:hypothetical protein
MRIRTIKPDFWTDEKVVALSIPARLFFIALWNYVDDGGRCAWQPRTLKLRLFPADGVNLHDLAQELVDLGLVSIYEVESREYLQVVNFERHQKLDNRYPSRLPPPALANASRHFPPTPTVSHQSPTPEGNGMEGKGVEGNGVEGHAPAPGPSEVAKKATPEERERILVEAMEAQLLDTSPRAMREWKILARKARISQYEEAAAFVAFAARLARSRGESSVYPRMVLDTPQAWRDWARARYWRPEGEEP